jgi:predicted O-methyltransferase YrrM
MRADRRALAARYYASSRAHDEALADRLRRFRNLEPPSAELLAVVARAAGARRILELGTSNGYSTLWLGDAAEANGGSLLGVDVDSDRIDLAHDVLAEAGLSEVVELRVEDAAKTLAGSADGQWDLVFLDAERPHYVSYLDDLVRSLKPGGALVVDNVLSHADELRDFTQAIEAIAELTQTVVPVGAGLRVAVKSRGRE